MFDNERLLCAVFLGRERTGFIPRIEDRLRGLGVPLAIAAWRVSAVFRTGFALRLCYDSGYFFFIRMDARVAIVRGLRCIIRG